MSTLFGQPWLLLLVPVYGLFLLRRYLDARRAAGASKILRRRADLKFILHGGAALLLICAAAGMHLPSERPRQQIVLAADVSASVFDLGTQNSRVHEILKGLDPQNVEVAVAVFGATAGSERLMAPLATPEAPPTDRERDAQRRRPRSTNSSLPDLSRLTTVVDRSATDLGEAINFSRGLFTAERGAASRAIWLLSDFRNTRGAAEAAAASLSGSGIDLLTTPVLLGPSSDVHISALRVPESSQLGRALPIEVTVASQTPATVRVKVFRKRSGGEDAFVDYKTVELTADPNNAGGELRRVVRILDHPDAPGVAVYTAHISGTEGELSGDINSNNRLSAAARIIGPSRWAVLTRAGSTLDGLARNPAKPLGAETIVFDTQHLPQNAAAYQSVGGIVVDGLSAQELGDGAALAALTQAVEGGKALLAIGGEKAFGAGGHQHAGAWENLLPADMTPEDDRTRSVLFLIDVSKSMDEKMGRSGAGVRKIDFASEQLAQAVQKLKPLDRLGLITFSGNAKIAAQLSGESSRAAFLNGVKNISIQANTDILPAIKAAADVLKNDDAEEQLVVLLSDGVQTAATPHEDIVAAVQKLCAPGAAGAPRRTSLFTFGIGIDPQDTTASGEKLLKSLADAGGGTYSPEFLKLAERLERAFESQKKDFFVRHESFALRPAYEHPLLGPSGGSWPALPFRNRVRAKPSAESLLWSAPPGVNAGDANASRKPDPLLILSGSLWPGASRRAVLALSLDGPAGAALLGSESGKRLLPSLLEWMESKKGTQLEGWTVQAEPGDDDSLGIDVRANDPVSGLPINGRRLSVTLTALQLDADGAPISSLPRTPLHPSAPGVYRAMIPALAQGIYRLSVHSENQVLCERFVSVPYPAELRRFGADRAAMQQLVAKAGAPSRAVENARDLGQWAAEKAAARDTTPLAPYLVVAAIGLLLAEFAKRRS